MKNASRYLIWTVAGTLAALLTFFGAARLLANPQAPASSPAVMSYQGYLADASGPISGTVNLEFRLFDASSGGVLLWQETHLAVPVEAGYFTVMLGQGTPPSPLTPGLFGGSARYLEVSVDSGPPFPRQQLSAVPYAFQADQAVQAEQAASAPWSGLTGKPSGLDDGDDDTLGALACAPDQIARYNGAAWVCVDLSGGYANVITVAKENGDYTSVAAALDSIVDASADNRYLVWVAPGVYSETQLVAIKSYVHLRGAGPNATVVRSTRTGASPSPDAATARLFDNGRISDISIYNEGVATYGIGVWMGNDVTRATFLDNVTIKVFGAGGVGHYAAYLSDAEPTIRNSWLSARGASGFGTAVNAAVGSVNVSGPFPQPLIENSTLLGGTDQDKTCADNTGTGFGLQLLSTAAEVRDSYICGGHRGISASVSGLSRIQNSAISVSGTSGAFLFETTNSATVLVATSVVQYLSNKHTGTGGLVCVHSYLSNYTAASDGNSVASACN
ncbi:MAG: hypothetical protein H3C34_01095 [Caldilineaceae bacterium]|nr:hypothetical protein [Caldilineaceae bacterium]